MGNEKKSIITGFGWAYGQKMVTQAITLLVSIVLARLLDPDHYGVIALITVFISILDAFVTGGFGKALVQKKDASEVDFNTIAFFSLILSIVLYIGIYFFAPVIATFYEIPAITGIARVMGVRIIFSAYNSIQHAFIEKHMQFKRLFFSTLGGAISSAIIGVVLAYLGFGIWALVFQYLIATIVDTIVLTFTIPWKMKFHFSWNSFRSLAGFGFKMLGATLVNTLQDNVRSLVIGKVFTTEDLAFYNQGKKYPAYVMNNLVGSFQSVMLPVLSREQGEKEEMKRTMRMSVRMSSFVVLPIVIGMIAVADHFIVALLTEKWSFAIPYMRILSIVYLTRPLNAIFQSALLAIGKSGINLFHEVIGTVCSLSLILVSVFVYESVMLIAWSSVIVMLIGTTIFVIAVRFQLNYKVREMITDFFPFLTISAIMGGIVLLVGNIPWPSWLVLIIQIVSGIGIYILLCYIFRIKEFRKMIDIIKQKLLQRKQKDN